MSDFIHLHVHTHYSLLDGMIRINDVLEKAKQCGMTAIAITDHGNLFGAIDFYRKAKAAGIKPIIGCELYVAQGSRFDKHVEVSEGTAHHIVVLAENMTGYHNLLKLATMGYFEGFCHRPRIDKDILSRYHEGLIGLSACLHGEIAQHISQGNYNAAKQTALEYEEIFGKENFFLEIVENGLPEQTHVNNGLIDISRELGIPLLATNNCHYLNQSDSSAHEILTYIQKGGIRADKEGIPPGAGQCYFRSSEEMKKLFHYCPEAIKNTVRVAERCNVEIQFGKVFLPNFAREGDRSLDEMLEDAAICGLDELMPRILRGKDPATREIYERRLFDELAVIREMGFAGYFLIVSDFIKYAKQKDIPVGPGRGSTAGSLVAYTTQITNIDPIRYSLFFEPLLNPHQKELPDIVVDFGEDGRDEIIRYVTEKYGKDKVAQIITFGKRNARSAIRDVGRAMNIPYEDVEAIANMVPNKFMITLEEALKNRPRLNKAAMKNEKIKILIDVSQRLEGLNVHVATHAASVVISDAPLVERVPLYKNPHDQDAIVTQFSMYDLQALGLIKFDFLRLMTLTVIQNAVRFIKEGKGIDIDINNLPMDDPETYQLLSRGDTDGVFQCETSGMKNHLINLKPDCIEDVMALRAMYNPRSMSMIPELIARKRGKTKITHEVPELNDILKETYGIIIYWEQIMQIAGAIGGYTISEADTLRKVMCKKMDLDLEKERSKFLDGAKGKNILKNKAMKIFNQMKTSAGYVSNKAHTTAYSIIAYQTAYLKAHYTDEFMKAYRLEIVSMDV